jgi:hypothetical protein
MKGKFNQKGIIGLQHDKKNLLLQLISLLPLLLCYYHYGY